MCRVLTYLGEPVLLDDLLYKPDSSLVTQATHPQMLQMMNLAGFGLLAWDPGSHQPQEPFTYRSTAVPVFDANLKAMAQKLKVSCALAHVRGVAYHSRVSIGEMNLHPFRYEGARWAMAHNGDLHRFAEMRFDLVEHLKPAIAQRIRGNTDSEWMYALLLSQLEDPAADVSGDELARALERMLQVLRRVREKRGIDTSSPVNLFLTDGQRIVAARFTFDYGRYPLENPQAVHELQLQYLSLWYTSGTRYGFYDGEWKVTGGIKAADSVILASEPLTRDVSTWLEVQPYSLVYVERTDGRPRVSTVELDV